MMIFDDVRILNKDRISMPDFSWTPGSSMVPGSPAHSPLLITVHLLSTSVRSGRSQTPII